MLFNEPKLLKSLYSSATGARNVVSVLFNEPKLLKSVVDVIELLAGLGFSALQRAEIAEILLAALPADQVAVVSVLFNEPKLLKLNRKQHRRTRNAVSVLFNEPKLLKFGLMMRAAYDVEGFSALQRAEIAEIW